MYDPFVDKSCGYWSNNFLKCQSKGEFMDYKVSRWWSYSFQPVYGEVEYILNQYYFYIHQGLSIGMIHLLTNPVDTGQITF
jgi:hypothetical protein